MPPRVHKRAAELPKAGIGDLGRDIAARDAVELYDPPVNVCPDRGGWAPACPGTVPSAAAQSCPAAQSAAARRMTCGSGPTALRARGTQRRSRARTSPPRAQRPTRGPPMTRFRRRRAAGRAVQG
eukprot:359902-Chlamydomonas_euryale.AAC.5